MKSLLIIISAFYAVLLVSCNESSSSDKKTEPADGRDVIRMMHERYAGKWYTNFTFSQTTMFFEGDSLVNKETWVEALRSPGCLSVRFGGFETGDGLLFANDSMYTFEDSVITEKIAKIHDLVVLGFDVYNQDPELTFKSLEKCGYELSKMHVKAENGQTFYVVGAAEGDTLSNRFYIDKERMLFFRMVKVSPEKTRDIRFVKYEEVKGKIVATRLEFFTNGKLDLTEDYYDIDFPQNLNDSIFSPEGFARAKW